jgi:hypothetical protein
MTTQLPPVTVETPAPQTVIVTTVKRSWKARALTILNAVVAFVLALLSYLQSVNLTNFGITPDRALFWMACIGLAQFILMQLNPVKLLSTEAQPGSTAAPAEEEQP